MSLSTYDAIRAEIVRKITLSQIKFLARSSDSMDVDQQRPLLLNTLRQLRALPSENLKFPQFKSEVKFGRAVHQVVC